MVLTIDIGNSNIAFGIHSGEKMVEQWRLRTDPSKTADEYRVLFRSLLSESSVPLDDVQRVVVSSVVPALSSPLTRMIGSLAGQKPLVVSNKLVTGLKPGIPAELGADLLANAVAANALYEEHVIIVDFGTALSFTAVSDAGEVLGVTIAPGLRAAMEALTSNTAQLLNVELLPPPDTLGQTTVHAIQSGVVLGYVSLVEGIVGRMTRDIESRAGGRVSVVATGGMADAIAPLTEVFTDVRPWHTLDGLRILADLNPA
ncbi:MAG: type III pantothenate kinase [Alkalispirochaetaceae bacterium]